MFELLGTYPLGADLFAQAVHPNQPLVCVGLSNGRVDVLNLPSTTNSQITSLWATRRHQGSVRSLTFSHDGASLFTAGSDGLVKGADSSTGRVNTKIAVPDWKNDQPYLLHALSPQTLLLGTDSGALYVYDLRNRTEITDKPQQTHNPHDEYVSSITPLPPTKDSVSGLSKLWVTTGGTTVAVTDLRKGIVSKSEDQEVELLCSAYVGGLPKRGTSVGEKVLIGEADGYLRVFEKGVWDDMDERILVDSGETLDTLRSVPKEVARQTVAVGTGAGEIKLVKVGSNKVVATFKHAMEDGVEALDFDSEGRMISGGGSNLKIWAQEERVEADEPSTSKPNGLDFGGLD